MDAGYAKLESAFYEFAPFSSDKIRAKSVRILSAAITRTTRLLAGVKIGPPAGVRLEPPAGVRIEPPAGVRVPRDDFHSGVG